MMKNSSLKTQRLHVSREMRMNTSSSSDAWISRFIAQSDWLAERKSANLMTKEMGNGQGVDLTWWVPMLPLISSTGIPPRTLEGGVGVCRQLKVTAHCHSTVQSHYTSRHLRSCLPSSHDGQMTIIPARLFTRLHLSDACDFVPIYILKSVKLYCWLTCQVRIFLVSKLSQT